MRALRSRSPHRCPDLRSLCRSRSCCRHSPARPWSGFRTYGYFRGSTRGLVACSGVRCNQRSCLQQRMPADGQMGGGHVEGYPQMVWPAAHAVLLAQDNELFPVVYSNSAPRADLPACSCCWQHPCRPLCCRSPAHTQCRSPARSTAARCTPIRGTLGLAAEAVPCRLLCVHNGLPSCLHRHSGRSQGLEVLPESWLLLWRCCHRCRHSHPRHSRQKRHRRRCLRLLLATAHTQRVLMHAPPAGRSMAVDAVCHVPGA